MLKLIITIIYILIFVVNNIFNEIKKRINDVNILYTYT